MNTASFIGLLLFCSVLSACGGKEQRSSAVKPVSTTVPSRRNISDTSFVFLKDTLYGANDSIKTNRTKCYLQPPDVTQLPFGWRTTTGNFAKTRALFADLESGHGDEVNADTIKQSPKREIKSYVLPPIKKIQYISLPDPDTNKCEDGTPVSSLLKLTRYQYQLPNMGKYRCYYFTEFDNRERYPSKVNSICWGRLIESFYAGYLILYDPTIQEAKVIKIYRDTFEDGMDLHTVFYIDRQQQIELKRFSSPSDEDGDDPAHPLYDDYCYSH